jgi:hypothetical protein
MGLSDVQLTEQMKVQQQLDNHHWHVLSIVMSINYKYTICDYNREVSIQQSLFKKGIKKITNTKIIPLRKTPEKLLMFT